MKLRRIVSLTALLSFIVLILTCVILYIVPHGRVAYWSCWTLWGLSKDQWTNLHINTGILFLIAIVLHSWLNFKPIVNYLKNKTQNLVVFTKEFNISLIILLLFCAGTYFETAPFSWVLRFGESLKTAGTEKYGDPPYGHAELSSLKIFTQRTNLDLTESMTSLKKAGINFIDERQTIKDIAASNNLSPKQVYEAMKPSANESGVKSNGLPENPPAGLGMMRLDQLCDEYGIDVKKVLEVLDNEQIDASKDVTIKQIAEQNKTSPMDVYTIIRNGMNK